MDNFSELLQVEHVKIKRLLGRGGFAAVYQGTYGRPGEPPEAVAIKVLQPAPDANAASEDEYVRMFLREATCTKQQDHKHIIRCYGVCRIPPNLPGVSGLTKTTWAMVLELAEAQTTKSLIVQSMTEGRSTYTNLQAFEWLTQIASALAHLHGNWPRIIHRDIKQENMLLKHERDAASPRGKGRRRLMVKLADLGLHVVVQDDRSMMLRRKSHYSNNRSVHRQPISQTGGLVSATGGASDSETPFLTVTAGPSLTASRAASVTGGNERILSVKVDEHDDNDDVVEDGDDDDDDDEDVGDDDDDDEGALIRAVGNPDINGDDAPWRVSKSGGSSSSRDSHRSNSGRGSGIRMVGHELDLPVHDVHGVSTGGKVAAVLVPGLMKGAEDSTPVAAATAVAVAVAVKACTKASQPGGGVVAAEGGSCGSDTGRNGCVVAARGATPGIGKDEEQGTRGRASSGWIPSRTHNHSTHPPSQDVHSSIPGRTLSAPPTTAATTSVRAATARRSYTSPPAAGVGVIAGVGSLPGVMQDVARGATAAAAANHGFVGDQPRAATPRPGSVEVVPAAPLLPGPDPRDIGVVLLKLSPRLEASTAAGGDATVASAPSASAAAAPWGVPYNAGHSGAAARTLAARAVSNSSTRRAACAGGKTALTADGLDHDQDLEREGERAAAEAEGRQPPFPRDRSRNLGKQAAAGTGVVAVESPRPEDSQLPVIETSPRAASDAGHLHSAALSIPAIKSMADAEAARSRRPASLHGLAMRVCGPHHSYTSLGTPPKVPLPILEDYSFISVRDDSNPGRTGGGSANGGTPAAASDGSGRGSARRGIRTDGPDVDGDRPASSNCIWGGGSMGSLMDASSRPGPSRVFPSAVPSPFASTSAPPGSPCGHAQLHHSKSAADGSVGGPQSDGVRRRRRGPQRGRRGQRRTPAGPRQPLSVPGSETVAVSPEGQEAKDSIEAIISRNPDLVKPVEVDASLASGMRRMGSLLNQFRQSQLWELRRSSIEWVFDLTGRAGSCMYMAPEVFRKLPYNEKADVYSFAVLMYELLCRELLIISYFNTSKGPKLGILTPEDFAEKVCEGYRPPRTACLSGDVWSLIEACWHDDPVQRPGMNQVLERLEELFLWPHAGMLAAYALSALRAQRSGWAKVSACAAQRGVLNCAMFGVSPVNLCNLWLMLTDFPC